MAIELLDGQPFSSGAHIEALVEVDGPASYVSATGQPITAKSVGMNRILHIAGGTSHDGTHFALGQNANKRGGATAHLRWFLGSTGAEIANTTDLSAERVIVRVIGI